MDKQFKITKVLPCAEIEYLADGQYHGELYQRKVAVEYYRTTDDLEYVRLTVSVREGDNKFVPHVFDLFQLLRQTNTSYKFEHLDKEPEEFDIELYKEFDMTLTHESQNQKGGVILSVTYDEVSDADMLTLISYETSTYKAPRKVILPLPSKGIK